MRLLDRLIHRTRKAAAHIGRRLDHYEATRVPDPRPLRFPDIDYRDFYASELARDIEGAIVEDFGTQRGITLIVPDCPNWALAHVDRLTRDIFNEARGPLRRRTNQARLLYGLAALGDANDAPR